MTISSKYMLKYNFQVIYLFIIVIIIIFLFYYLLIYFVGQVSITENVCVMFIFQASKTASLSIYLPV